MLTTYKKAKVAYLRRIRWAVASFYFSLGLCFSTWASRIPDIKTDLHLGSAALGTVLFALPLGQLIMMPFSGKLVTHFGSHKTILFSISIYIFSLSNLGLANNQWQLTLALLIFGISGNLNNISVNTQAVYAENIYKRPIMASFHGVWSLAGFTGALFSLLMLTFKLTPHQHFLIIGGIVILLVGFNYKFLIKAKKIDRPKGRKLFSNPDKNLLLLGMIGFCSMASEGIMFDWSGIYFKEVVKAPGALIILGYTSFMIMMASGRFLGDGLIHKFGKKKVLQISGLLVSIGFFIAVIFPFLIPSIIAFMMIGIGVAAVIPTIYSLAGKNTTIPVGEALTIVSSVSFLGFLMGPPIIGYIAEAAGLRFSFAFIGIFGFLIAFLVTKIKVISD